MANSRASKKRIKTNKRNSINNSSYNSLIKTFTKKYINLIKYYKKDQNSGSYLKVKNYLSLVFSLIDKAAKKNILQKNTAARRKSRLFKILKESYNTKSL